MMNTSRRDDTAITPRRIKERGRADISSFVIVGVGVCMLVFIPSPVRVGTLLLEVHWGFIFSNLN